ncbi:MAG: DUF2793 domain-containing protein [Pseudomonadota bacterium]
MEKSDRLSLSYVMAAQSQKHVTVNETTRALDALVHMTVLSQGVSAQPASPTPGDGYILPTGKTGANWAVMADNAVTIFQDNAWTEYPPTVGMTVYVADEAAHVVWDGSAWADMATGGGGGPTTQTPQLGVNTSADATNKVAVKSDAVLHSHDDVTPGTGDVRHVLNKSAVGNTASHLFQTGFSARAEFGLTGTDEFTIKVSPDGSTFFDAIVIDQTTGEVSFPNTTITTGGSNGGNNGGGGTPPDFSPDELTGLMAWFDPDDATTLTLNGNAVSQMDDKSGNDAHAVQATGASQPQLAASAIGSRSALAFTGTEFVESNSLSSVFGGNDTPFSLHMVIRADQTSKIQICFSAGDSTNVNSTYWVGVHSDGDFRTVKRKGSTASQKTAVMAPSDTNAHIMSMVHDGLGMTVWYDGVKVVENVDFDVSNLSIDRVALGTWVRTNESFDFEGKIGEVFAYNRTNTDEEIKQIQAYLGAKWINLPQEADLVLALGQSNMQGVGNAAQSPILLGGVGYHFNNQSAYEVMRDPVGDANTGGCLPSFAARWHQQTGRTVLAIEAAEGGSALLPAAQSGNGNWDKISGSLYGSATTAANAAIAAVQTDTIFTLTGQYVLWGQGERDSQALHSGTAGVSQANYETALQNLITNLEVDLSGGLDGFFIFETGARDDAAAAAEEPSWAAIRAAQNNVASSIAKAHMVFTNAKNFPSQGKMSDALHYTQTGYNEMGDVGATNAAATLGS